MGNRLNEVKGFDVHDNTECSPHCSKDTYLGR